MCERERFVHMDERDRECLLPKVMGIREECACEAKINCGDGCVCVCVRERERERD